MYNNNLTKRFISLIAISSGLLFSGCGGSDSSNNSATITAVDGYIKGAIIKDNSGQNATYTSNGKYTFNDTPTYPITLTGGKLEDTNLPFDINMSVSDGKSLVISPITTFLQNNSNLLSKFANLGLNKSTLDEFSVDYINTNDTNLSKLSQLLYTILKNTTLTTSFKTALENNSSINSLNSLFSLANNTINSSTTLNDISKLRTNSFLNSIKDYNGTTANIEDDNKTKAYKYNLVNSNITTISHNGTSYGTVMSPYTGKIWLDRNLGATKVCDKNRDGGNFANDNEYVTTQRECFGDYYQWGRDYDGHQESNSTTSSNIISTIVGINNTGSSSFILDGDNAVDDGANYDWVSEDDNGSIRSSNWSKIDGNSVCPLGFRVPTIEELRVETIDLSGADDVQNRMDAFNNFLKLPSTGFRTNTSGSISLQGVNGFLWSSSVDGSGSFQIGFKTLAAKLYHGVWTYGCSVRCVRD